MATVAPHTGTYWPEWHTSSGAIGGGDSVADEARVISSRACSTWDGRVGFEERHAPQTAGNLNLEWRQMGVEPNWGKLM